jgi:hypothetical protein
MDGGKLLHDFPAVTFIVNHALNATDLAFDPAKALDKFFFRIRIYNLHFFSR